MISQHDNQETARTSPTCGQNLVFLQTSSALGTIFKTNDFDFETIRTCQSEVTV